MSFPTGNSTACSTIINGMSRRARLSAPPVRRLRLGSPSVSSFTSAHPVAESSISRPFGCVDERWNELFARTLSRGRLYSDRSYGVGCRYGGHRRRIGYALRAVVAALAAWFWSNCSAPICSVSALSASRRTSPSAEYVRETGDTEEPLFDGGPSSITFVRPAIGPGSRGRLEIVRIAEIEDSRGIAGRAHTKGFCAFDGRSACRVRRPRRFGQGPVPRFVRLCRGRQNLGGRVERKQTAAQRRTPNRA